MGVKSCVQPTNQAESTSIWQKALSHIKQRGIINFTFLIIRRLMRTILRIYWNKTIILERSLEEPIREITPKIPVQIMQVTKNDVKILRGIVDEGKYRRFEERFKKDRICFAALHEDEAVGYAWLSLDDEYEPGSKIDVKLNDKEAYLYDDYVVPKYRQNRLQSLLQTNKLKYLHTKGYQIAIGIVEGNNPIGLRTCISVGFVPKRTVTLISIFGFKFHRWQKYSTT